MPRERPELEDVDPSVALRMHTAGWFVVRERTGSERRLAEVRPDEPISGMTFRFANLWIHPPPETTAEHATWGDALWTGPFTTRGDAERWIAERGR
jgi:hypothetical protein